LLSDKVISLAGHSFTIHHFWLYLSAAIFLFALVFFSWGYFRGKSVAGARSVRRDELSIYFGRVADSLEMLQRAVNQISFNMSAETPHREVLRQEIAETVYTRQQSDAQRENAPPAAKPVNESRPVFSSMFGR
jgi:hypothetical protein